MSKKGLLIIIITLLIIGGGIGGYLFFSNRADAPEPVEEASINPLDYLVFELKKENYSEYQKEKAFKLFNNGKNNILQALENGKAIESNDVYYDWLSVTSAQHMIGDYEREAQILKWFTLVYPGNSVSPSNLGNLYKSFIVDNQQSEKYYLMALEREKKKFDIYYGLYELYRYSFNDADKAIGVLMEGWQNNPNEKDYVNELVDYLVGLERIDEAGEVIGKWLVNHPEDYSLREKLGK